LSGVCSSALSAVKCMGYLSGPDFLHVPPLIQRLHSTLSEP
jgi:hypothetical protein